MSRLNDLLRQLEAKDPSLAKELRTEYDALADRRSFGLNFERHTPESVELPGRKVRRGDKVHVLPERGKNPTQENSRLWRVTALDRATGTATIEPIDSPSTDGSSVEPVETIEAPLTELVVVAEFRDPIYPGLVSTGRVERGGDKPFHTVINAENFHALQTLLFTHRGQVDCIYIDPPYNTGNEGWIYNDKYVAGDDHYKHSKWLAFMERRLLLAKELLKPTGVIMVAIGDDEHHRLRMLLDQVFEPQNFVSNVVWQGRVKSVSRFTAGGVDYMLMYAKDLDSVGAAGTEWREGKDGVSEVLAKARQLWRDSQGDSARATSALRRWMAAQDFDAGVARYRYIDENGRVHRDGVSLAATTQRESRPRYEVLHPITGRPCKMPAFGWRWSPGRMEAEVAAGKVMFGSDESTVPTLKMYIDEASDRVPPQTFSEDRFRASKHLENVLGDKRFPFPKNHEVVARWIGIASPSDSLVLDFFGGSGTTAESVARLNEQDGGTRRCILITNNEVASGDAKKLRMNRHRPGDPEWEANGVFEFVTRPRLETVATGVRSDGSIYSDGLEQNLEFLTLTYEAPLRVSSNRQFAKVAPLLWMKAGSQGRRIDDISNGWDVADTYGVLGDLDQTEAFLKAVARREADGAKIRMVFVVTDEDRLFSSVCRELPEHIEAVRLYEAYLRNFEIEAGRSTR